MHVNTLKGLLHATFGTKVIDALARETGAFERIRTLTPKPFVLSLLTSLCVGPRRSISSAHRVFERITGTTIARSSFDEKVASPEVAGFLWQLFAKQLLTHNRQGRRAWPPALQSFYDILIEDGTQMRVRNALHQRLCATTPGQAALTCIGTLPRPVLSSPYESQLIVKLPTGIGLPQNYGVLLRDGALAPVDDRLGTNLQDVLSDPNLRIANQEEALSHVGRGGAMPSSLAVAADGTNITSRIALRGRSFEVLGRSTTGPVMRTPQDGPALAPEPRQNFEPVYSRAEGRLFVVGGENPTNHAPVGTIWWRDVDDGATWNQVPLAGYSPASVLASTYSYRDKKLWVLDELKVGGLKRARLVRIDPVTGDFEQVGQWLRLGLYDQHWLVLDKDGEVLLVASSSLGKKHTVVRFDNHGATLALNRIYFGLGNLVFKPMVDADGYSFVIDKNLFGSTHNTETRRTKDLGGLPALWQQLTNCW